MVIREVADKDIIKHIVEQSKPNKEEKKGFYLFDNIENDRYNNTLYFIAQENEICIGIISYTENSEISYKDYPYILAVQSIRKGVSYKLIRYVEKRLKTKGYLGLCISNKVDGIDMTDYYTKIGYVPYDTENMQKTFNNNVNDLKTESKVDEGIIGSTCGMDSTFSASHGLQGLSYGYVYKILPLSMNLQQPGTPSKNERYIHVGCRVSGYNKNGDLLKGKLYRIVKNSDGVIIGAYIFSDKTHSIVKIKVDGIKLIESSTNDYINVLNEFYTDDMAILCEYVKKNGSVSIKSKQNNNIEYTLTLHEGEVKLFKTKNYINERKIENIETMFEASPLILKSFIRKIQK